VLGPCVCSASCVRWKFVYCSCVCHGLKAHLCILSLILDHLWRELFFDSPFFIGLLLSRAGPYLIAGFPIFSPSFAPSVVLLPFLPYHSTIPTMVLFDPCLLGFFRPTACFSLNDSIWWLDLYSCYFGFLNPLHCLWAPLSHFFLLKHPWPICFPWASSAHFPTLHSHGLLLTLLSFPGPITSSFISGAHGFSIKPLLSDFITSGLLWPILTFLHRIMPMGLLLLSLGSFRPIYLLYGSIIHCSCHSGLMFFCQSTNSSLPILLGFFLLLGF